MKVILLGVGMQGEAALCDLVNNPEVTSIVAADREITALKNLIERKGYKDKVKPEYLDARNPDQIERLFAQGADVAIDLMPIAYIADVVAEAVRHNIHLVNTFFTLPGIMDLENEILDRKLTILPEFGLDPGIDLVLLGRAVRDLDLVEEIRTYGAGLPEPAAANNPLKYKVTWTFEGVLNSYFRTGTMIHNGELLEIPPAAMFAPGTIHEVEIEGLGRLEAYPNGNVLKDIHLLGIRTSELHHMGRYTLRFPGHSALWKTLIDLHLLDDEPVVVDGAAVDRKRFIAGAIGPHIHLNPDERDIAIDRVEVRGWKNGRKVQAIYQVIDWRDMETGFTAMSRTVGFTAAIGAWMIGTGKLTKRGVLSPLNDVPYDLLVDELHKRGINVTAEMTFLE